jgi:hypothetical protein
MDHRSQFVGNSHRSIPIQKVQKGIETFLMMRLLKPKRSVASGASSRNKPLANNIKNVIANIGCLDRTQNSKRDLKHFENASNPFCM